MCRTETSLSVALWFHGAAVVASVPPLLFGYPAPLLLPLAKDWGFLLIIAVLSFINQMCLNRGFQLEVAAKASAVNYTQASHALYGMLVLEKARAISWKRLLKPKKNCSELRQMVPDALLSCGLGTTGPVHLISSPRMRCWMTVAVAALPVSCI